MTTARDVIANILNDWSKVPYDIGDLPERIIADLLCAPEPVRLALAAKLNPWRPIETAPKDRPILVWMWDGWAVAKWNAESPRPYWEWWADLPAPPSEDK